MKNPIQKIRHEKNRGITASVFKNEYGNSICLQIGYKKDGEWKNNSITILSKNLPAVMEVLAQSANLKEV